MEEEVAELGPGDHFGEIGLIKNIKRTATIRALSDCHLAVLLKDDFISILKN